MHPGIDNNGVMDSNWQAANSHQIVSDEVYFRKFQITFHLRSVNDTTIGIVGADIYTVNLILVWITFF